MTSKCPLDSFNLDLVTETDHLNNYCYCSKCSCGLHKCPRPASKRYPKSTFNSYYKINYKRHSLSSRPASSTRPYKKSQFKMQSETTASHDFQAWDIDKSFTINKSQINPDSNKFRLSSSSTYKQDFTNWGTLKTEMIKQASIPVNTGVKFQATSTYSNVFVNSPGKASIKAKPHVNTNILCTGDTGKAPETTMKISYVKQLPIPSKPIKKEDNTVAIPAFPNQYATVNSINYNAKELTATIRRAKRCQD